MPKLANGYTRIANEIMDEFAKIRIPGRARQILDFILRKTYGWNKKTDKITLTQFVKGTGLNKVHIVYVISKLLQMNLITKEITLGKWNPNIYGFNKDFKTWRPLSKKITTFMPKSSLKKKCYICGYDRAVEKHHIIPLSEGGLDRVLNIAMLCPNCHTLTHKGEFTKEFLIIQKGNAEVVTKNNNTFNQKRKQVLSPKITIPLKDTITKDTITKDKGIPPCPQKEIIKLYHEILPGLPSVETWPKYSGKQLRMRWREDPKRQHIENWEKLFLYIKKSEFLMGNNNRGWTADLFWIVHPINFAKILSGKYHKNQKNNLTPYEEFINERG